MLGALPALGLLGTSIGFGGEGGMGMGVAMMGGLAGSLIGPGTNSAIQSPGFDSNFAGGNPFPNGFGFRQATSSSLGGYLAGANQMWDTTSNSFISANTFGGKGQVAQVTQQATYANSASVSSAGGGWSSQSAASAVTTGSVYGSPDSYQSAYQGAYASQGSYLEAPPGNSLSYGFGYGSQAFPGGNMNWQGQGAMETAVSTGPLGYGEVGSGVGYNNYTMNAAVQPYVASYGMQGSCPQSGYYGYQGQPAYPSSLLGSYQIGALGYGSSAGFGGDSSGGSGSGSGGYGGGYGGYGGYGAQAYAYGGDPGMAYAAATAGAPGAAGYAAPASYPSMGAFASVGDPGSAQALLPGVFGSQVNAIGPEAMAMAQELSGAQSQAFGAAQAYGGYGAQAQAYGAPGYGAQAYGQAYGAPGYGVQAQAYGTPYGAQAQASFGPGPVGDIDPSAPVGQPNNNPGFGI